MTGKSESKGTKVDWSTVELATEVNRTYLVTDRFGRQFYKMYKPSVAQRVFKENGWRGEIVSTLDRSLLRKKQ